MEVRPGYKQTAAGVIPEDWEVRLFGEIASLRNQTYDSKVSGGHEFCIELEHIGQGTGVLLGASQTSIRSSTKKAFLENDVLFGRLRAYLRKYWLADRPGVASGEVWPIAANTEVTLPKYLFQIVQTNGFMKAASEAYGTHMPRSDWSVVKGYCVPLPSTKGEQAAIASALCDADSLIASIKKLIAKKQGIKRGAMQQLLTGRKRLPGFSGEWQTKRLDDVFRFLNTANNPRNDLSEYGNVKYIHYGDIHTRTTAFLDCESDSLPSIDSHKVATVPFLEDGDLVMVDASEDYSGIGKSIEVRNATGRNVVAGLHTLLLRCNTGEVADGYKAYLQFIPTVKNELIKVATGISVYGVSKHSVKSINIRLPYTIEQRAIAEFLMDMDFEIASLESKLDKCRLIKQGMMQELLTGKKRLA